VLTNLAPFFSPILERRKTEGGPSAPVSVRGLRKSDSISGDLRL
jgi:hypothetical protein